MPADYAAPTIPPPVGEAAPCDFVAMEIHGYAIVPPEDLVMNAPDINRSILRMHVAAIEGISD
jgi:hypothetical protein